MNEPKFTPGPWQSNGTFISSTTKPEYVKPKETKLGEYVPCPRCGTMMANTKRAKAHCKGEE